MTLEQIAENIPGNLRDAYQEAKRENCTLMCVDQLMKERITKPELRNLWLYTADGEVYSVDDNVPTLRITREPVNPVLNNIDDACDQLIKKNNYQVTPKDFEAVKAASDTVAIDLTKLSLQGNDKEWRYLAVNTSKAITDYEPEEQKLLRRVFGPTDEDYTANMEMLRTSPQKIAETKIYVLNPDYVRDKAKKNPVGRASWLGNFNLNSGFNADVRYVNVNGRLRRVRLVEVAEGDAPKKSALEIKPLRCKDHYQAILADPDEAVKNLDDQTASGLLNIVSGYLSTRKQ